MVFVLDNYDSFTYNLVQYLGELGAEVVVRRNDELTPEEVEALKPERILLSPGPCTPHEAGILVPLIRHMAGKAPILGVCLGHQAIGEAFGGKVIRAHTLMHGKTSAVEHDGKGVFSGLPTPLTCTRYHSLIVEENSLPEELDRHGAVFVWEWWRVRHHGSAASQLADRRGAVSSRKRADRGRPSDDPQLPRSIAWRSKGSPGQNRTALPGMGGRFARWPSERLFFPLRPSPLARQSPHSPQIQRLPGRFLSPPKRNRCPHKLQRQPSRPQRPAPRLLSRRLRANRRR